MTRTPLRLAASCLFSPSTPGARADAHSGGKTASHTPRIFVLSLPHGPPIEETQQKLLELCDKGDVIIDAGNEWWERTERRQKVRLVTSSLMGGLT